jgi:hypothetical protein
VSVSLALRNLRRILQFKPDATLTMSGSTRRLSRRAVAGLIGLDVFALLGLALWLARRRARAVTLGASTVGRQCL